jgi:hypothetical protein
MRNLMTLAVATLLAAQIGHTESARINSPTIESEYKSAALRYGLNPLQFKALLFVESSLDHTAVNPLTLDFGIGQINYRTAEAYKIDTSRLVHDRAYSIDRAAFVMSKFQRQFKHREPATWLCRYNVGGRKLTEKSERRCIEYNRRIKLAMEGL